MATSRFHEEVAQKTRQIDNPQLGFADFALDT
jgi:hypothetical protein